MPNILVEFKSNKLIFFVDTEVKVYLTKKWNDCNFFGQCVICIFLFVVFQQTLSICCPGLRG